MKATTITALLSLAPATVLGACNADNVLRALRKNGAQASPFCVTYTLPHPKQPLPTYVSQYPASRVSSACSCLITPGPTPTTGPELYKCSGDLIKNGGFQTVVNVADPSYRAPPWVFAAQVIGDSGQNSSASLVVGPGGDNYASLSVQNLPSGFYGITYIQQPIPALCYGVTYTLTYTSQLTLIGGGPNRDCSVDISISDQQLVYIGPPAGDSPPFSKETRSYTFTYYGNRAIQDLTIQTRCTTTGIYDIDNISLVGTG
ncbi:MAG: hypothetical protein L6R40_000119 [Gallowayella cf. fulva]|nr:MAG: hypothetical protein L6R40_000119 [Xanthomendoza cf. fulva]